MRERTYALMNQVLETITLVLAYPTLITNIYIYIHALEGLRLLTSGKLIRHIHFQYFCLQIIFTPHIIRL